MAINLLLRYLKAELTNENVNSAITIRLIIVNKHVKLTLLFRVEVKSASCKYHLYNATAFQS